MKLLRLLFCAAFGALTASAAPVSAPSRISAVTVYTDRAVVTRTATLDVAAGPVQVEFEKLPAELLDQSLQVAGRGTAQTTLVDVTPRSTYVDFTPNERVKALEDQLRDLGRQDRAAADRTTVLNQQRDYVLKIQNASTTPTKENGGGVVLPDVWTRMLTFTEEQLGKISSELQTLDAQREDFAARRSALEQQLNELRGEGGRSYKTVTVRLDATRAGSLELTLRYSVPGASWTPSYDARVNSSEATAQLGYFGLVRQNTGEDWKAVELTLSTARPGLGGAAPELSPWIVQQQQVRPMRAQEDAVTMSRFEAKVATANSPLDHYIGGAASRPQLKDMAGPVTTVDTQATSATFRIAAPTDVPADNTVRKIGIATVPLKTELDYQATPKLVPGAFLAAKVTNSSDYPLLGGAMNVFLDDTFVAASSLHTVMPGEKFDLALGADEGVAVTRKLNNRFTEDTGLVNKGTRITYDITITVQNNKKSAAKVVVRDQVPVSRHEKIVVKVLAPDERVTKPDADGTIKWTLDLKPGEKRELPLKFSVEYPNDLPVAGLE